MTDTTTQPREPIGICKSCGSPYAVRFAEKHKRACGAVLANRLDAWQQRHGGEHIALDDHLQHIDTALTGHNNDVRRIDEDYNTVFEKIAALEQQAPATGPAPAGITIDAYLDTDDDDEDPTPPAVTTSIP